MIDFCVNLSYRFSWPRLIVFLLGISLGISNAQAGGDFLAFAQVDASSTFSDSDSTTEDDFELIPALDLFVTRQYASFQFLGELFLNEDEQELERFQFSWSAGRWFTIWLGRYHNPIGYWNTEYHHGTYLQPTVQRPRITQFEDDGGLLPTHISGLLVEGSFLSKGESEFQYMFSVGYGPELDSTNNLEPLDILDPSSGAHKPSVTINLSYVADSLAKKQIGLFANVLKIPTSNKNIEDVEQSIYGIYAKWVWGRYDVIASMFFVEDETMLANVSDNKKQSGSFNATYAQLSYQHSVDWKLYSRYENLNDKNDPYLKYRSQYLEYRGLLGLQFELNARQSTRVEFSHDVLDGRTFNRLIVQWNAVFS